MVANKLMKTYVISYYPSRVAEESYKILIVRRSVRLSVCLIYIVLKTSRMY